MKIRLRIIQRLNSNYNKKSSRLTSVIHLHQMMMKWKLEIKKKVKTLKIVIKDRFPLILRMKYRNKPSAAMRTNILVGYLTIKTQPMIIWKGHLKRVILH